MSPQCQWVKIAPIRRHSIEINEDTPMIELQIKGMSCRHCVKAVTDALSAVAGVSAVESVELESGVAVVQGSAAVDDLVAAVKQAGYEARVAE